MIVDANILLFATDADSPHHEIAAQWLTRVLNGDVAVGIPWQTITAFVRISTHPRIYDRPLTGAGAWEHVEAWLAADPVWVPPATETTARIYGRLCNEVSITGNLVTDGMLAAIAMERGVELVSADADFAHFPGLRWVNPLHPAQRREGSDPGSR